MSDCKHDMKWTDRGVICSICGKGWTSRKIGGSAGKVLEQVRKQKHNQGMKNAKATPRQEG